MELFECPYLGGTVELTDERVLHIRHRHTDILSDVQSFIGSTLGHPDEVRLSVKDSGVRLFVRWFPQLRNGKYAIVVVRTTEIPELRHWIVTGYIARRRTGGIIEWQRA